MIAKLLQELPPGAEVLEIAFVPESAGEGAPLLVLPQPISLCAVRARSADEKRISLLLIPAEETETADLLVRAQRWVEHHSRRADESSAAPHASQITSVQGARLVWAADRAAILASPQRLPVVRDAFLEAAYCEGELRDLEREVQQKWSRLNDDIPSGFELTNRSARRISELRAHYEQAMRMQARLARLRPLLLKPHVYPPTVASQVGERIRERSRVNERVDWLAGQLDVFEKTYERCSERVSNYLHARTGHRLEWAIIALLLLQTAFWTFELLTHTQ